jgi:hypothetical protein
MAAVQEFNNFLHLWWMLKVQINTNLVGSNNGLMQLICQKNSIFMAIVMVAILQDFTLLKIKKESSDYFWIALLVQKLTEMLIY